MLKFIKKLFGIDAPKIAAGNRNIKPRIRTKDHVRNRLVAELKKPNLSPSREKALQDAIAELD